MRFLFSFCVLLCWCESVSNALGFGCVCVCVFDAAVAGVAASVVVVVVNHHEVVLFILDCDDFQIISFPFEESNQSQVGFWLHIDGGDLSSIDSKLRGFLDDGILHQKEWLESCKTVELPAMEAP